MNIDMPGRTAAVAVIMANKGTERPNDMGAANLPTGNYKHLIIPACYERMIVAMAHGDTTQYPVAVKQAKEEINGKS